MFRSFIHLVFAQHSISNLCHSDHRRDSARSGKVVQAHLVLSTHVWSLTDCGRHITGHRSSSIHPIGLWCVDGAGWTFLLYICNADFYFFAGTNCIRFCCFEKKNTNILFALYRPPSYIRYCPLAYFAERIALR